MQFKKDNKKNPLKVNAAIEKKSPKPLKRKRAKLFSRVSINVPLAPSLMMILPEFSAHAEQQHLTAEQTIVSSDVNDKSKENTSESTNIIEPNSEPKDNKNEVISDSRSSNEGDLLNPALSAHIHSGHHLSEKVGPSIIYIPATNILSNSNVVDTNTVTPTSQFISNQPVPNQSHMPASVYFVTESIVGKFGTLQVDSSGKYQFILDPHSSSFIALPDHTPGTDTFTLHRSDGSTLVVHIPVAGEQDQAVINGDLAGSVTEDKNVDQQGLLQVSGKLDVVDPDQGESGLQVETIQGLYGVVTTDKQGHWQYQVDNSQAVVQQLLTGGALHESINVHTIDGTVQTLDLTIGGTDDNATISGVDIGSVTEDLSLPASGKLTVVDADAGEAHFSGGDIIGTLGTLHLQDNGAWTYDLDNKNPAVQALSKGATATDIITVHSADGTSHQVTITVNGTNDLPVISGTTTGAVTEAGSTVSGVDTATGTLTATDPDTGDTLTWAVTNGAGTYGSLSIDSKGEWHYQLDNSNPTTNALSASQQVQETFTITATDSSGNPVQQVINVDVKGSNDLPVISGTSTGAVVETGSANAGTAEAKGTLTATDPDTGDTLTWAVVQSQGAYGDLTIDQNGDWHYSLDNKAGGEADKLAAGQHEQESFWVTATDSSGTAVHHKVTVGVTGSNDLPVISGTSTGAVVETGSANAGTAEVTGTLTATDPDTGDTLKWAVPNGGGTYGALTIDQQGEWHYQLDNKNPATNALPNGQHETETFTVTATDSSGNPVQQVITVDVTGSNDLPVISGRATGDVIEAGSTSAGVDQATGVLTTIDPDTGDTLTWTVGQGQGTFGSLSVDANGQWHYQLDNSAQATAWLTQGQTEKETFTVSATDSSGKPVDQIITINITGANDNATITDAQTDPQLIAVTEDRGYIDTHYKLHYDGHLNISDPDKGEDQFDPQIGTQTNQGIGYDSQLGGHVLLMRDGGYTYTIDNRKSEIQQLGEGETLTDHVTVRSIDGTTHVIAVVINGTNDNPTVSAGVTLSSGTEDTDFTLHDADLLANAHDVDHNDQSHLSVQGLQAHKPDGSSAGTITDNHDGSYTFQPEANYNGAVSFAYTVVDAHGGTAAATATTALTPVGDAATIWGKDTGSVIEDRDVSASVTLAPNMIHTHGQLHISDPEAGEAQFNLKSFISDAQHPEWAPITSTLGGHLSINQGGWWQYQIDTKNSVIQKLGVGESKVDHITVSSADGTSHVIAITIHGTNDKPVLGAINTQSATEDGTKLTGQFTSTDVDAHETASYTAPAIDGFTLNTNGSYSFDPSHSSYQHLAAGKDQTVTIPVTVTDKHGATDTKNLVITVHGTEDASIIGGQDTGTVTEDVHVGPDVAGNAHMIETHGHLTISDLDAGEAHFPVKNYAWRANSQHPELHPYVSALGGYLSIGKDGSWFYRVDNRNSVIQQLGAGETTTDTVTIHSLDGTTHEIQITIQGTNDNPKVTGSVTLASGTEDTDVVIQGADLLANATDIDDNDVNHLSIANLHADHGSIAINTDGTFTFTPEKDFNGQVNFSYDVKDTHGGVTHTGATTSLAAVNDAASVSSVSKFLTETDAILSTSGTLTSTDVDNTDNAFTASSEKGAHGDFAIDATGAWTFTANAAFNELNAGQNYTDTFKVTSVDGTQSSVTVQINGTNDAATVSSASEVLTETDAILSTSGTLTSTDVDNVDNSFTASTTTGANGDFAIDAAGHWTFTANSSFDSLNVKDNVSETFNVTSVDGTPSTVTVTINGTNDAPTLSINTISNTHGTLVGDDVDVGDNQQLQYDTIQPNGHFGTLSVDSASGAYQYKAGSSVAGMSYNSQTHTYSGQEVFEVRVADGNGGSTNQFITFNVTATVTAPAIAGGLPTISTAVNQPPTVTSQAPTGLTNTPSVNAVNIDIAATSDTGSSHTDNITSDNTPTISGTTDLPFSKVEIFEGTKLIATTSSDATGHYIVDTSVLSDATHQFTAQATAPSASAAVTSSTLDVTVDSTIATPTADITATTDSGVSHADDLTNVHTPIVTGSAEAGAAVVITDENGKTVGSGTASSTGTYTIKTSSLSEGAHSLTITATDIAGNSDTTTQTLIIDTSAPVLTINVDAITTDNVVNAAESGTDIDVSGTVGGEFVTGDTVTFAVNGRDYSGTIDATGHFSIAVEGSDLKADPDSQFTASVSHTDAAGNTGTDTVDHTYQVDVTVGQPVITFENPGSDNAYSKAEIAQGHAGTITATVHAAADAKVGEHININGKDHVLDANSLAHGVALEVAPNSIVKAIMTDEHGNVNSELSMAAGAKPEPIFVKVPSGSHSHHIETSLGVPTLIPTQSPVPIAQQGWKILVLGHYRTSATTQWGTLTINPKTGELSYQEHANTHTGPHGSAQNVGVHEDSFEIAMQGSHHDDVVMHVQVSILSHGPGGSGKLTLGSEVVDMTVTPVMDHQPPAGSASQNDMPEVPIDTETVNMFIDAADDASSAALGVDHGHENPRDEVTASGHHSAPDSAATVNDYLKVLDQASAQMQSEMPVSESGVSEGADEQHQAPDHLVSAPEHQGSSAYLNMLGISADDIAQMPDAPQPDPDLDQLLAHVDNPLDVAIDNVGDDLAYALTHHNDDSHIQDDDDQHHHVDVDGLPDVDPNS
jgi:VCBS repeat-containing protein